MSHPWNHLAAFLRCLNDKLNCNLFQTLIRTETPLMQQGQSIVANAPCTTYNKREVKKALDECIAALPDFQNRLAKSRRVLLKPNLLSSTRTPEAHVNTHPAVTMCVTELLIHDFGCEVWIGDSCGSLTLHSTARAIENSGINEIAKITGAKVYNVDARPREVARVADARIYRQIPLPGDLNRFDTIISLPKLKTHHLTYITAAVKNLLGLVPGAGKKQAHLIAPRGEEFASLLCDLYAFLQPDAAIVDAIVSMDGKGPNNGHLQETGMIAASTDCVALDSFCARVLDMDPVKIPLLKECSARGLGNVEEGNIEIRGKGAEFYRPTMVMHPPAYKNNLLLRFLPRFVFRIFFGALCGHRAYISQHKCKKCGECARNCPSNAIFQQTSDGRFYVDQNKCFGCYCCDEVCPWDAIEMRSMPLRRTLDALSTLTNH
jgi:uncharacterized protein (DUF362 family)/Pyruvate/2-oxoacid:ferredoxin oxidoreductase delta subunit